ncbi:MAG: RHS repeat-associated core domain-containing protein, partial [Pirellulales bacterium]|nr:RHS repeat-associated core domain-containing protein [Pirellulales bacterium]
RDFTGNVSETSPITRTVNHTYDGLNRWIGSENSETGENHLYVHDAGQISLEFVDGNVTDRYLWAGGVDQLLAQDGAGVGESPHWTLTDHLGSVRDIVDENASLSHTDYDAFGNVEGAAADLLFGYTSRPYDGATELQNNHHRWYDSQSGRWISQDPIGFAAGDANLYRYVGNGPTTKTDPSGLVDPDKAKEQLLEMFEKYGAPPRPDLRPQKKPTQPPVTYVGGSLFGGSYHLNDSYFAGHPFGIPTIVCHGRNGTGRYGPGNSFRFPGGPGVLQLAQSYRDTAAITGIIGGLGTSAVAVSVGLEATAPLTPLASELAGGGSVVVAEGASSGTATLTGSSLSVEGAYVQGISSTGRWLRQLKSLACELGKKEVTFENVSFLNYSLRNQIMSRPDVVTKVVGEGVFGPIYRITVPVSAL